MFGCKVWKWYQHAGWQLFVGWVRGIILGLRWVALPGVGRTKTASGRFWCQAEGPEPLGKYQSGMSSNIFRDFNVLLLELSSTASVHGNKE
eukprot:515299-Pelagomonas_calceolata.AAC.1